MSKMEVIDPQVSKKFKKQMWNVFCWTSCIYRVFKKFQYVFQGYISGNMKLNQFGGGGLFEFHSDLGASAVFIEKKPKWGECPHFSSNMALLQSKFANKLGLSQGGILSGSVAAPMTKIFRGKFSDPPQNSKTYSIIKPYLMKNVDTPPILAFFQ